MAEPRSASQWIIQHLPKGRAAEPVVVGEDVLAVEVTDHEKKTDKLKLKLDNHKLDKLDSPVWERGQKLLVSFGHTDGMAPPREYIIRKIEGGRVLTVTANGKAVLMDTTTRRKLFENVTRADIVRSIAIANSYETRFIDDTEEVFEAISQHNLTDAQFLRKLADKEGFQFFVDHTGLHWHERAMGQAPIRELIYHVDPAQGDILDFTVENDISRKPGKVVVRGRDPLERKDFSESSSNSEDKDRDVLAGFVLIHDRETGKEVLTAVEETVATNATTAGEAKVEAKRRYRKVQQTTIRMKLDIIGDARILAKSVILISGMGARYSGKYYVQSAAHKLSGSSGFLTVLHVVTDGHNHKKSSGSNTNDSKLLECSRLLSEALFQESTTSSDQQDGELGTLIDRIGTRIEGIVSGTKSERVTRAQSVMEELQQLRTFAVRNSRGNLARAASECIAAVQPLTATSVDDPEAEGKVNKGEVVAPDALNAVGLVDQETGQLVIAYEDKQGRSK